MQKETSKKTPLSLSKETLRVLDGRDLQAALGGAARTDSTTSISGNSNTCCACV